MLEIGILVFLLLAGGYWVTLWIMGRRDDVLHGQFVEFEGEDELSPATCRACARSDAPEAGAVQAADGHGTRS